MAELRSKEFWEVFKLKVAVGDGNTTTWYQKRAESMRRGKAALVAVSIFHLIKNIGNRAKLKRDVVTSEMRQNRKWNDDVKAPDVSVYGRVCELLFGGRSQRCQLVI